MSATDIADFLRMFDRVRGRTLRVVACIPLDQLEWSPRAGMFTFGDIVRHLVAMERYMFVENVLGRPSRYPGHGRELAGGHEAVSQFALRLHQESVDLLRPLSNDDEEVRARTNSGSE